jgi:hypothetical protein
MSKMGGYKLMENDAKKWLINDVKMGGKKC